MRAPRAEKPGVAVFFGDLPMPTRSAALELLAAMRAGFLPLVFEPGVAVVSAFDFDRMRTDRTRPPGRSFKSPIEGMRRRLSRPSRRQLRDWEQVAREREVRLVHAFSPRAGARAGRLARALDVPLLVFVGESEKRSLRRSVMARRPLRRGFVGAELLTASSGLAERLLVSGMEPARCGVFHWGVSIEGCRYCERPGVAHRIARGQPLRFLQLGVFDENAGHRYTIEAFRLFLGAYPASELVLLGSGGLQARCVAQASRMGIGDRVRIVSDVDAEIVAAHVREADVLLHHGLRSARDDPRGAPRVILQAMATGLPIVATLGSAVAEFVREGANGALAPARDVEQYAARLREVLAWGPEKGRAARERMLESFDPQRRAAALGDLYARLVAGRAAAAPEPASELAL